MRWLFHLNLSGRRPRIKLEQLQIKSTSSFKAVLMHDLIEQDVGKQNLIRLSEEPFIFRKKNTTANSIIWKNCTFAFFVASPPRFTPLARIGNHKNYGYLKYNLVESCCIVMKMGPEGWSNFPKGPQPANSIASSRTQVTIPGPFATLATSFQIFLSLHSDDILGDESYEYQIALCLNFRTKMHNEIIMYIFPLAQMIKC